MARPRVGSVGPHGHPLTAWQLSAILPLLLGLVLTSPVAAAPDTYDIQRLRPLAGPGRLIGEATPEVLEHLSWSGGLLTDFAGDPLIWDSQTQGSVGVVASQLGLNLGLALGLFGRTEVGLVLPMTLAMSGDPPPPGEAEGLPAGSGAGLGDLRLSLKIALVQGGSPFALSLIALASAPTGDETKYLGDGGFGATFAASSSLTFGRLALIGNAGYRLRGGEPLPGTLAGDEFLFGGGGLVQILPDFLDVRAEAAGVTGVSRETFGGANETVLESRVAAYLSPIPALQLSLGGGIPILYGIGNPSWRVFAGVTWSVRERDRDRDGVLDVADRCPLEPEDFDQFEDQDGCPDPDNDQDRVADALDRCPGDPEDRDNFQDEDGCPDEDNEGDGIPDLDDGCTNEPEDMDGFQDEDGCPDPDNDGDGLCDPWVTAQGLVGKVASSCTGTDTCPDEAEDLDQFEDGDGCPDLDNDSDGLPDRDDRCPNQPETWNTKEDSDGCPDEQLGPNLIQIGKDRIVQLRPVQFPKGEPDLRTTSFPVLDQVASLLKLHQGIIKVRLEGWADANEGNEEDRRILGDARAQAVFAYLTDSGVDAVKLEAIAGFLAAPTAPAAAPTSPPPGTTPATADAPPPATTGTPGGAPCLTRQPDEWVVFHITDMLSR